VSLTGARYLVQALRKQGVEVVFGYPGGSVLDICDAFIDSGIRFVLTRHEQGAALAADGYARATGRTGVCLATSGPGATNLITGLANAHMDSVPVVALTGQVQSTLLGTDAFQEADTFGVTLPVTKHSFLVSQVSDLPLALRQAFHIAGTGRRGPVLVDIPRDVAKAVLSQASISEGPVGADAAGAVPGLPGYRPTEEGHPVMLRRAVDALLAAKRPLIWAGGGVIAAAGMRAAEHTTRLAELCGAPVITSLMGIGSMRAGHPLYLGMLGMHGTPWANWAVRGCDLLLALGVRFDDRATGRLDTFAPGAEVVHIDIDPAEIGKLRRPAVPVVADLATALPALCELAGSALASSGAAGGADGLRSHTLAWREAVAAARQEAAWPQIERGEGLLHPAEVLLEIGRATSGEAIMVADVGQHQMWAAQLYPVAGPRRFMTSGGLGTMGYAVPAALGAQAGRPGETVIAVVGDGGFQMTGNELATIVEQGLPVKVFVLNNGYLGMVRQWQQLFYDQRYMAVKLSGPDFVKLADAYGVPGRRVVSSGELADAVAWALREPGPALVECRVDPDANVLPIVPPGKGSAEAIEVARASS